MSFLNHDLSVPWNAFLSKGKEVAAEHRFNDATKWASRADWDRQRPLITRLYAEERRPLKEIMEIMANEHGHHATIKMYKSRITKWGLDKNNKPGDVAVILRKKTLRDAIGKTSMFRIRGKQWNAEELQRYLQRKLRQNPNFFSKYLDQPTPPHIECWTPSASPNPSRSGCRQAPERTNRELVDGIDSPEMNDNPLEENDEEIEDVAVFRDSDISPTVHQGELPALGLQDLYRLMSLSPEIPKAVLPPQVFVVPERVLSNIKNYFAGAFESKLWILRDEGACRSVLEPELDRNHLLNFGEHCTAAARLFNQGYHVLGRRSLSKALDLVPTLLRVQNPLLLCVIFQTLHESVIIRQEEVANIMRNHLNNMATTVLAEDQPWTEIWKMLAVVDTDQLRPLIERSWRCAADAVVAINGVSNDMAIRYCTELIYTVEAHYNLDVAERHLRALLANCEQTLGVSHEIALAVLHCLGLISLRQGKGHEAELVSHDLKSRAKLSNSLSHEIHSLLLLARARHLSNDRYGAETSLCEAINLTSQSCGDDDPCRVHLMLILEQWLRDWARDEEAHQLGRQIHEFFGPDDLEV